MTHGRKRKKIKDITIFSKYDSVVIASIRENHVFSMSFSAFISYWQHPAGTWSTFLHKSEPL